MIRKRTAILVSGRGSNMRALIAAAAETGFPAEIVLVLSNVASAPALGHAAEAGIRTSVVSHKAHVTREGFDRAMQRELETAAVEIVCLAGFMRLLSPWFCDAWQGRMINIHPALLPAFKGLDTHRRAIEEGVRIHGCTAHFVEANMDAGPIIRQGATAVLDEDTPESLGERVLELEHKVFPEALRLLASGSLRMEGRRVLANSGPTAFEVP
jgi:phosphoribosylglycinamide formyltransferase 1